MCPSNDLHTCSHQFRLNASMKLWAWACRFHTVFGDIKLLCVPQLFQDFAITVDKITVNFPLCITAVRTFLACNEKHGHNTYD